MEIGPVRVASMDRDGPKLEEASTTWSEYADVLYGKQAATVTCTFLSKAQLINRLVQATAI